MTDESVTAAERAEIHNTFQLMQLKRAAVKLIEEALRMNKQPLGDKRIEIENLSLDTDTGELTLCYSLSDPPPAIDNDDEENTPNG